MSFLSAATNLFSTTTDRVRNYTSGNEERDGNTEDDTAVCRALRKYYNEQGRAFPQWLPPDPNAPQSQPAKTQFVRTGQGDYGYGNMNMPSQQQTYQQAPGGLQRGNAPGRGGSGRIGNPSPSIVDSYDSRPPAEQSGGVPNMKASLRAKFGSAARTSSPSPSTTSSQSTSSRQDFSHQAAQTAFGNSYSSQQQPPSAGSSYNPAGGAGGRLNRPGMSANNPWSGGGDDFGGAYDGSGGSYGGPPRRAAGNAGGGRMGLPGNPRMR